ncbi:MAG TPA: resolvase [Rhodobacteraceae bacterium]|nr:resolvase [Paracoccaceae bacterium]
MIYGYARVSTNGQSLAAQKTALEAVGVEKLFSEKVSGAQAKRRQLELCLGSLKEGDTLVVTRLDRLARSTRDLLNIVERVSEAGSEFRSLAEVWADTTTSTGRLMLTVLGGIAEFERDLIRARTAEGRAQAKAAGRSLGRPFKLTPHQQAEVRERKGKGESVREIARTYNVSPSTISRV